MTQIIGTIEWNGVEYLRVIPTDPEISHCDVCHFQKFYNGCPNVVVGINNGRENLCLEARGGGCFVTRDELIKLKLKGEL